MNDVPKRVQAHNHSPKSHARAKRAPHILIPNMKVPSIPTARFDKSFSLIFTPDGEAGLNFEHSWGDGVAVLRFCDDVHEEATRMSPTVSGGHVAEGMVTPLTWHIDAELEQTVGVTKQPCFEDKHTHTHTHTNFKKKSK